MTPLTKYAYHVCPQDAAMKIIESGHIDPKFSTGRNRICWYVSQRMIAWAIAHVAKRYEVPISQLAVFTVKPDYATMKRASKRGIYYCAYKMKILEMASAQIVLDREERYVHVVGNGRRVVRSGRHGS